MLFRSDKGRVIEAEKRKMEFEERLRNRHKRKKGEPEEQGGGPRRVAAD